MDFPLSGRSAEWNELDSTPVALALGRGPEPPGHIVLALAVDDVAAAVEELRAKGVPRRPQAATGAGRVVRHAPIGG
jgi:hypothetical protein